MLQILRIYDRLGEYSRVQVYYSNYRFLEGNQIPIPFTFLSKNIFFSNIKHNTKISLGVAAVFLLIKVVSKFSFGHFLWKKSERNWNLVSVPKLIVKIIHLYCRLFFHYLEFFILCTMAKSLAMYFVFVFV